VSPSKLLMIKSCNLSDWPELIISSGEIFPKAGFGKLNHRAALAKSPLKYFKTKIQVVGIF